MDTTVRKDEATEFANQNLLEAKNFLSLDHDS